MRKLRGSLMRLGGLFDRLRKDHELAEELESHLQMHIEDNLRQGMTPEQARRQALIQLGGTESTKEAYRDQRGVPFLEALWQDVRYCARMLRKNPGFTALAVLTLAIGIGANTVVFSVAKAVLFRPLGFREVDRLMWIRLANAVAGTTEERLSWRDYEDIDKSTRGFQSVALFGSPGATWEHDDRIEELPALRVTAALVDILQVRPALGRMLLPSDNEESATSVVLISHELWQERFGGKPDIIGQTLRLNEESHIVVGVLPRDLQFPLERAPSVGTGSDIKAGVQAFWFPMRVRGQDRIARDARMFLAVGRLKPGVSEAAARAELAALGQRLAIDYPETNRNWSFDVLSFRDQVLGRTRQGIPLLAAAVAAVLLICCANLANLLLARGITREHELAVRVALGAGRRRLVQTLLTESALLSLLGGIIGITLASVTLQGIRGLAAANVPFVQEAAVDLWAIVFTAGLSALTALVFGWLPTMRQSRIAPADALRTGARATAVAQIRMWQRGLLVGQVAVVLVRLTSAGFLLESFRRLIRQDLGYQPESVVALDLSVFRLATNDEGVRFYRDVYSRLAAAPGVKAVGTIQSTPLTGRWTFSEKAEVFGKPVPATDRPSLAATFVAFDYFQAMGIPLIAGRFFYPTELRDDDMPPVVILNEAAVATLFPGRMALGQRVAFDNQPERYYEVIGVVRDTRDVRLEQKAEPRFYLNFAFGGAQVVARSSVPTQAIIPLLRDALKRFGSRVIVHEIRPMTEIVSATVAERRFLAAMLAAYAAVALAIAATGIFGVVACQVAQRTNEFAVRLALGASPRKLVRLVLVQTGRLVLSGLLIGLGLSLATNRLIANQIFGLSPYDPILLTTVSTGLLIVALLAGFFPARRVTRVDPITALRYE